MASDISNSDDPFEVREAGDGKGLGCFATRDIKPGETILVTYTSMTYYDSRSWTVKVNSLIDLYESLDASDKREWSALHGYYNEATARSYMRRLAMQRPDGTYLTQDQQDEYLSLLHVFDSNCFGTEAAIVEASVMFTEASRFNHSCDPNVTYECNTYPDRWVGRANRHIAAGEELTISYISCYSLREERQWETATNWGFTCACTKCTGGLDTYTASLERARDIANGLDGSRARPEIYGDNIEKMTNELHTRVDLLRDIVKQAANPEERKWRSRELAMALWEASMFHRRWRDNRADEGNDNGGNEEEKEHSRMDVQYASESVEVAKDAWSHTHEMYKCLQKEAKKGKAAWDDYMKE
ncbi:hypothetical protein F4801DRAFT_582629 [Xylaria longipes]|nr:hypothetical protein F4801DRAFT_582629 [Xylaria longipes]RYC58166.1 hypothetical protein CHU98_g8034 [Xylaria longipes]